MTRLASKVLLLAALALLSGCSGRDEGAEFAMTAYGSRPLIFEPTLSHAAYVVEEAQQSFWFSDVPFETLLAHEDMATVRRVLLDERGRPVDDLRRRRPNLLAAGAVYMVGRARP